MVRGSLSVLLELTGVSERSLSVGSIENKLFKEEKVLKSAKKLRQLNLMKAL